MEYKFLVLFHVLGAAIWIGGFMVAAIGVVPRAKKAQDVSLILDYLDAFKIPGHIALTIQLLTGLRLAMFYMGGGQGAGTAGTVIGAKLFLLIAIVIVMIAGKKTGMVSAETTISKASGYVYIMALIAVSMMVLGLNFKLGLF